MLAALVRGRAVVEIHRMSTPRGGNPELWLAALFDAISGWNGRYDAVGAAVAGIVDDGFWSPINRRSTFRPLPADGHDRAPVGRRRGSRRQ
jgi:N-acylmannosamine kinase/N-acetylmannosamine-6-phosphate 2-epimerase/N-acetylmannosamine kinase